MGHSANDVYSILRKRIILGEFAPGERLKEQTLADELQVSRTPVRAALRRLTEDGLAAAEPNRGVVVVPWADRDSDEVFDLRALVEAHAAGLAAQRRQPEHIARLESLNDAMAALITEQPQDFLSELQRVNRQFHETVLHAAASPRLAGFTQDLLAVERVVGAFFFYSDDELRDSLLDHRNITRAIARGEARLARALVDAHIRSTWTRLREQRCNQGEEGGG